METIFKNPAARKFSDTVLVVLGGFAGAGKSTIARMLSTNFNLPRFSSDIFTQGLQSSLNRSFHETTPVSYDILFHVVHDHLAHGITVILDTNMCRARTWENLDALLARVPHVRCVPIIFDCPLEVLEKRIEYRGIHEKDHLNLGGDQLKDVLWKYEFIKDLQRPDIRRIDSNRPIEEVYKDVLEVLSTA